MGFRRNGKQAHEEASRWQEWLNTNADLLMASDLPASVLRCRDDWMYLLRFGYHCDGIYPNIDYRLEEQTEEQRAAFRCLLEKALTADEKKRGSAAWHHVCPPTLAKEPEASWPEVACLPAP